ncbi:MAG: phosphomannomutase/phosphoglucomutase [Phycisphaerae bacterium]|nr:phosphomannomutase/phosphoglucomutase [Phycisphaerae bacterium]
MPGDESEDYQRYCPGEQRIRISDAVCLGRRRANFHKCPGCQFNDDEHGRVSLASSVVGRKHKRGQSATKESESSVMIEKVFKAYDVRATVPDMLNEDVAWRIGNATAQFLRTSLTGYDRSDEAMNKLIVGRDMRKHSPMLCNAFIAGAAATGTQVVDVGMIDTSQLYFATNHMSCCGGATTTASHNPANYNGFKICGPKGKPIGSETGLKEIQRIAAAVAPHASPDPLPPQHVDLTEPYREYLHRFLMPLKPLKMAVDASNGMGGCWFPKIFDGVPNLEVIPLNFEHDGDFVHAPNPLVASNLDQLRQVVREQGADFGACFDGDADRCMFVDEHANIVRCDLFTALLAGEFLRDHAGATVVYDLRSSRIVPDTIRRHGGKPKRERVGHVFMKRAMAENDGIFGGELSGHFYFRDFFNCDSGMLALIHMLNVLTRTGQPLSGLIKPLEVYAASGERNFENEDKQGTIKKIEEAHADAQIDYLDGITVQYENWWFNVRMSNTEPLLRLNMEANTRELLDDKLRELTPLLGHPVDH